MIFMDLNKKLLNQTTDIKNKIKSMSQFNQYLLSSYDELIWNGYYKERFSLAQWLTPVILTTWEAEIGRTAIQGQPQKKVSETPISTNKKLGICHLSYEGSINSRIMVQDGPGINTRPYLENT
jgi:hypothetical protein